MNLRFSHCHGSQWLNLVMPARRLSKCLDFNLGGFGAHISDRRDIAILVYRP